MKKRPIDKAIDAVAPPTLTELARRMKVEPQVIANWRKRGVPVDQVPRVERATIPRDEHDEPIEGAPPKVLRHEIRPDKPDLFPRPDERVAA